MSIFEKRLNNILVLIESGQDKSELLTQLDTLCHQLNIPVTVIGGMAVAAHKYRRFTADIDILIKHSDAPRLANTLLQTGWIDIGSNKLQDNKTKVILNFCADSVRAGRNTFPPPEQSNPGVKVASLPLLLILKIRANRHKDRSDVVELIKANNLTQEFLTTSVLPALSITDQRSTLALYKVAIKEQRQS